MNWVGNCNFYFTVRKESARGKQELSNRQILILILVASEAQSIKKGNWKL